MTQQEKTFSGKKEETSTMDAQVVLRHPVISEKANRLSETGTYTFFVSERANKIMVRRAVSARFGVEVLNVRMVSTPYKKVRRGRFTGWKGGYKKAFVTIRPDQKIEIA